MHTPASIRGHPLHPMLVPIAIGCWIFSVAADLLCLATGARDCLLEQVKRLEDPRLRQGVEDREGAQIEVISCDVYRRVHSRPPGLSGTQRRPDHAPATLIATLS